MKEKEGRSFATCCLASGGRGGGGGKGKGRVGLMHVDSSCIFNLLFSSILFVVVFFLFIFSNQSTPVSVAAP